MVVLRNRKGIMLIATYLIIVILAILGGAFVIRAVWERKTADREKDFKQAFYIADAALNRAIYELKKDYYSWGSWVGTTVSFGNGEYQVDEVAAVGDKRKVTVTAAIPTIASPRITRQFETFIKRGSLENFYSSAMYVSGKVTFKGPYYVVNGDVRYDYETPPTNTDGVSGTITRDETISPLPALDFQYLYDVAASQGNVYSKERLRDVKRGDDSFPSSFWYAPPSEGNPAGTPNIVYLEDDLKLRGDFGTIGGFFVVAGEVLTDPDDAANTMIAGRGTVDGPIYTTGKFNAREREDESEVEEWDVNGGIWAGKSATVRKRTTINYNESYMTRLNDMGLNTVVQAASWREVD